MSRRDVSPTIRRSGLPIFRHETALTEASNSHSSHGDRKDCVATDNRTGPDQITYRELKRLSEHAATVLAPLTGPPSYYNNTAGTVGLMCLSSLEFIVTWLGLIRLGNTVLLVA